MLGYCEKKNNQYVLIESSAVYEAIMHERLDVLLLFINMKLTLIKLVTGNIQ